VVCCGAAVYRATPQFSLILLLLFRIVLFAMEQEQTTPPGKEYLSGRLWRLPEFRGCTADACRVDLSL
jgi:hypothetical protein